MRISLEYLSYEKFKTEHNFYRLARSKIANIAGVIILKNTQCTDYQNFSAQLWPATFPPPSEEMPRMSSLEPMQEP